MYNSNLCSAITRYGKECMAEVHEDAPLSMCFKHIAEVGRFWEANKPAIYSTGVEEAEAAFGRKSVELPAEGDGAYVYYIIHGDRIKIGTSSQWRKRISQLPHDRVLAVEFGDYSLEGQRHREFSDIRIGTSEWFHQSDELWDRILWVNENFSQFDKSIEEHNKRVRKRGSGVTEWGFPQPYLGAGLPQ